MKIFGRHSWFFFFLLTQTQWHKVIQNCSDNIHWHVVLPLRLCAASTLRVSWHSPASLNCTLWQIGFCAHSYRSVDTTHRTSRCYPGHAPRASLHPVAVKASSFGGRCCRIVALTRIFCLILAVDSRGDRGRASALHKSKLLQSHHAVSSRVPLCACRPQASTDRYHNIYRLVQLSLCTISEKAFDSKRLNPKSIALCRQCSSTSRLQCLSKPWQSYQSHVSASKHNSTDTAYGPRQGSAHTGRQW